MAAIDTLFTPGSATDSTDHGAMALRHRQRHLFAWLTLAFTALLTAGCDSPTTAAASSPSQSPAIAVLSTRADLVSGGSALVALTLPAGTDSSTVKINVDGRDISSSFAMRANGQVEGLVTGLTDTNVVTMTLPDKSGASITLNNHPNGGPVFAGAQVQPWKCASGAVDAQCNQPATYAYQYKSSSSGNFATYDPANPPDDVAMTTTDQGQTLPYIVRIETGHQDRGQYQIAVLFDPAGDWQPWAPQAGWDGKLLVAGGADCGSQHGDGRSPGVIDDNALSRGFAVMSSSLIDNAQNCNMVVQAEALTMLKEYFVKSYGPIRYTIGNGCSGGSITMQQNANGYPGLLNGVIVQCSFPDAVTTAREVEDCALLLNYWGNRAGWAPGVSWQDDQEVAVTGHASLSTCLIWIDAFEFNANENPQLVPTSAMQNCDVPADQTWTPANPTGVRCDLTDYAIAIDGTRPQDGYANDPINNTGVQYGLLALQTGTITPDEFVDLNSKVGSHDINYNFQPTRRDADEVSLPTGYRGGLINEANLLTSVPMIDLRGHDAFDIHLDYHSYEVRARLDRSNGGHDNQIIWLSPIYIAGDPSWPTDSLTVMDQWLAAIEADHRDVALASKVSQDKPAAAADRCYDKDGNILGDLSTCDSIVPAHTLNPRMAAGEALTNDDYRCQLKPLDPADYAPVALTDDQWTQLQAAFPDGVCDYSQPGLDQQPTQPWQTYADGPGGAPLGGAPVSKPLGS